MENSNEKEFGLRNVFFKKYGNSKILAEDVPCRKKQLMTSACSEITKILVFLNLGFTCILAIGTMLYFQSQIEKMENGLSELERDIILLREFHDRTVKKVTKRSSGEPSTAEEQLSANATSQGMRVVQFQGAIPIQHIQKQGRIGPWTFLGFDPNLVDLRRGNTEVEIKRHGLYFLHAQIFYITSELSNSFEIVACKENQDRSQHRILTTCSTLATEKKRAFANTVSEVSCYTGIATYLDSNDRLYLNQIEQNRYINFNQGFSHFGIIQISR